jgi:hypothetical protein
MTTVQQRDGRGKRKREKKEAGREREKKEACEEKNQKV